MKLSLPLLLVLLLVGMGCDADGVSASADAKSTLKGSDIVLTGPSSGYYDFFRFFNPQAVSPTVTSIGQARADFSTNFDESCSGFFHSFDVFASDTLVANVESIPDNDEVTAYIYPNSDLSAPVTFQRNDPNDLTQGRIVIGAGNNQAFLGDIHFVATWGIAGGGGTDCRTNFDLNTNTVKN